LPLPTDEVRPRGRPRDRLLLTAYYLLLTACHYCLLPTAYCLPLPTDEVRPRGRTLATYYLRLTTDCLLLATSH